MIRGFRGEIVKGGGMGGERLSAMIARMQSAT